MIVANGLFVAVEFAFVSVRRTTMDAAAVAGDRRSARVAAGLDRLSFLLSTVQFGITATSLVVGFLAERAFGDTVFAPLLARLGLDPALSTALAVGAAFVVSTGVQMVFGELLPKAVAVARPTEVSRALALFAEVSVRLLGPFVRGFDAAARTVTRRVFRVETPSSLDEGHTLDEVARIIAVSGAQGRLSDRQTALLRRAVVLGDRRVGEVMVPRPDVVWLEHDAPVARLRDVAAATGHSRFPVRGRDDDDVLGSVHVKDLLKVADHERATTTVGSIAASAAVVPESETLRDLLTELKRRRRTFAVVVDEYGSVAGIVTVEDVLEALVGDISDEFDRRRSSGRTRDGRVSVPGSLTTDRFAELFGLELPEGPYETVAGFLLDRLGTIPAVGALLVHEGATLEVARREGLRVVEVLVGMPVADATMSEADR
jgi:CBS domain containing-hemolysin-like protein